MHLTQEITSITWQSEGTSRIVTFYNIVNRYNGATKMDLQYFVELASLLMSNSWAEIFLALSFMVFFTQIHTIPKAIKRFVTEFHTTSIDTFEAMLDVNEAIINKLRRTMNELSCNRILIIQYHNGEHSIDGASFNKLTCTHEVVNRRAKFDNNTGDPVQGRYVGIPATMRSDVVSMMKKFKVVTIEDIHNTEFIGPNTAAELIRHGAFGCIYASLHDENDHVTGYILFEFPEGADVTSEMHINTCLNCAGSVSMLFETASKYKG